MPVIADVFILPGFPSAGAIINAYKASRFGGIPVLNSNPPGGGSDAGPVTTGTNFGAAGNFQITVPTVEPYYVSALYLGVTYWQFYNAPVLDTSEIGQAGGVASLDVSGHVPTAQLQLSWGLASDMRMDGVAAAGSTTKVADAGHVHPASTLGTIAYGIPAASQSIGVAGPTDLTGHTVTVTVVAGRRLKITGYGQLSYTDATTGFAVDVYEDGVNIGRVYIGGFATRNETMYGSVIRQPAAGTHTYKLAALRFAGTGIMIVAWDAIAHGYILVEDVGV